ncbi:MAG: 4Fe-4S dicluster domain-containing protein, partial [Planctomycetota bacterium]|nr:4Fe-4S dicluster domain-containing protein [Planctomycetota bacterium]
MLKVLRERLRQGYRTTAWPDGDPPALPERYRGLPVVQPDQCADGCRACADACPTGAIEFGTGSMTLDMGRCLFCTDCMDACPERPRRIVPPAFGRDRPERRDVRRGGGL